MRLMRTVVGVLVGAVLGAAGGRLVAQWRADSDSGLAAKVDLNTAQPHPKDLVPGLIAAFRVRDRPWSYLHVPPWLAAFTVNFAVMAFAHDLAPILRALGMGGVAEGIDELTPTGWGVPGTNAVPRSEIWTAEVPQTEQPGRPAFQPPSGFHPFAG